jgi:hypothetical protein
MRMVGQQHGPHRSEKGCQLPVLWTDVAVTQEATSTISPWLRLPETTEWQPR